MKSVNNLDLDKDILFPLKVLIFLICAIAVLPIVYLGRAIEIHLLGRR